MRDEEYHEGNDLVVRAEIPVLDPDYDVDIYVLSLHAERKEQTNTERNSGYRTAFRYGSRGRWSIPLTSGASDEDVKASYRVGILEVRVRTDDSKAAQTKIPDPASVTRDQEISRVSCTPMAATRSWRPAADDREWDDERS